MARLTAPICCIAFSVLPAIASAQTLSHIDAPTPDRRQGTFDLQIGSAELGLQADMAVRNPRAGETEARSRLATSWAPSPRLRLNTEITDADLNKAASVPSFDTSVLLRPNLAFLDRVEATVERATNRSTDSVVLRFTELDKRLQFAGADELGLRANFKAENRGELFQSTSNLESTLRFSPAFGVRSALRLESKEGAGSTRSTLDTVLVYDAHFGPIDGIEGRIEQRSADSRRSLAVSFSAAPGDTASSTELDLTGKAVLRETVWADGLAAQSLGLEARISAPFDSLIGGRSALKLDLERKLSESAPLESSLAYDHEWTPVQDTAIGLELRLLRKRDSESPSINLVWSTLF
jgi:hypothetical protein